MRAAQERLEAGDQGARKIWETMGVYLGYAAAHYSEFYSFRHVLILGRCTSGRGGRILLERARHVLEVEFPELSRAVELHSPTKRAGVWDRRWRRPASPFFEANALGGKLFALCSSKFHIRQPLRRRPFVMLGSKFHEIMWV